MELGQEKPNSEHSISAFLKGEGSEVITSEECKSYLRRYELSDQSISRIKDNLIGIVDSIFNSYLEEFK